MYLSRSLRLLLSMLLVLSLGGCSTVKGWFTLDEEDGKEPAPLVDIVTEIKLKKMWSAGVGSGQGDGFYHLRPVLDDDRIYAAGNDGKLVALDRVSGKRHWQVDLDESLSGGVGVGENIVLLGTSDGKVLALSAADGAQLWSVQLQGEILAPPQTNGRVVVVQSYDGRLHGLSAEDGGELWTYDSSLPVLTLRGTSTPIIFERFAIAGFGNGKVVALDLQNGGVRWEARVAIPEGRSEIDRIVDIEGSMLLASNVLYAVSYQGRIAAMDVATGRKSWQQEVSSYVGLDQGFGNVYVSEESGSVIAYYRNGQGVRWEQGGLTHRRLSAPKAVKGYVAVGDFEGYVHFMSQTDGHFVGRTKIDSSGIRADMLAVDDVLYVFTNGGKLMALQVSAKGG
ncbi:MAG: outer membrane protein assembly factor BamB [Halieaceae bacterium]